MYCVHYRNKVIKINRKTYFQGSDYVHEYIQSAAPQKMQYYENKMVTIAGLPFSNHRQTFYVMLPKGWFVFVEMLRLNCAFIGQTDRYNDRQTDRHNRRYSSVFVGIHVHTWPLNVYVR